MNFPALIAEIRSVDETLRERAVTTVNSALTMRNWLVGPYLVEYEQAGKDRADYGKGLLKALARELKLNGVKGLSVQQLEHTRRFYGFYPQLRSCAPVALIAKSSTLSRILGDETEPKEKSSTPSRISTLNPDQILQLSRSLLTGSLSPNTSWNSPSRKRSKPSSKRTAPASKLS